MHKTFALAPLQKVPASYETEKKEARVTEKYTQRIAQLPAHSFLNGEIYHKHKPCARCYHLAKQHQIEGNSLTKNTKVDNVSDLAGTSLQIAALPTRANK